MKKALIVHGNLYIGHIDIDRLKSFGGEMEVLGREEIKSRVEGIHPNDIKTVGRDVYYENVRIADGVQFFIYSSGSITVLDSPKVLRSAESNAVPSNVQRYSTFAAEGGVINPPVSASDPYKVLGVGSRKTGWDVGYICSNRHNKINIWSLHKPNGLVPDLFLPESANEDSGALLIPRYAAADINELQILNHALWIYPSYYPVGRLADFSGYRHNARPPIFYLDVTPVPGSSVNIGDTIKFTYNIAGANKNNVGFHMDVLKNRYLGVVVTGEKSNGTSEDGSKFVYDYYSQYRQVVINKEYFYDANIGAYVRTEISVELTQNQMIKPGATVSCLICLFDKKEASGSYVTSLLMPSVDPDDIILAPTTFIFRINQ